MESGPARLPAIGTILIAWLVVGVLDISSAIILWFTRGMTTASGLQGIAAPLLGSQASEGGFATAALGLGIHFFVALCVVSTFYFASRRIPFLTQHAVLSGVLYGIAVYLVMYWMVLPAAFPTFRHRWGNDPLAIAIHICLIGLPTALIVRRYSRSYE